jgi:predicted glycosyltransferase
LVRLWIDVLTPKQALFTKALVQGAPSNVKCTVTTRDYAELNSFVDQIKLTNTSIGKHGGGDLLEKLRSSIERQRELVQFVHEGKFGKSLCFLSPEAARVSFGLGIEHYVCSDSPHAWAPCRLAVPLSTALFSPYVIGKEKWTRYGIGEKKVLRYHALDPWAWLRGSKYQRQLSEKVKGRIVIRLEEWFASYFRRGKGVSDTLSSLLGTIKKLGDYEILLLPRYDDQRNWARKRFGRECTVPETTVDAANEISKSDLLIGGGATMTQEAALLGVPNISYFPSAKLDVFYDYYFPRKLSVEASTPRQLITETAKILRNIDNEKRIFSRRAIRETSNFEDPVKFIFNKLLL